MAEFQAQTAASLRIPTELVFLIVGFIPIDHILQFRVVSRSIKDHIDNFVLHSYLNRTTLVGYVGPLNESMLQRLSEQDADGLPLIQFNFSHLESNPDDLSYTYVRRRPSAVFQIDPHWLKAYNRVCSALFRPDEDPQDLRHLKIQDSRPVANELSHWFLQLDHVALDLDTGVTKPARPGGSGFMWTPGYSYFDPDALTVTLDWRLMLHNFLRMETELSRRMRKRNYSRVEYFSHWEMHTSTQVGATSEFTYGPGEDCVRELRREYFQRYLDTGNPHEHEVYRGLMRLPRLFGQDDEDQGSSDVLMRNMKYYENTAVGIIMRLSGCNRD